MKFPLGLICTILFLLWSFTSISQETFAHNFQSVSYTANDGSENFAAGWTETGEGTNANGGRIRVNNNQLRFRNLDTRYITRNLDLSAYESVTLTLDYNRTSGDETINVQLYDGFNYVTVANLNGTGSLSYDLNTNQIIADAGIRFISGSGDWDVNTEQVFIDNVLFTGTLPNQPPIVAGSGSQIYCPGSSVPVAQTINITDPDDTTTTAVYIQISGGYVTGEDILTLTGSHPNITSSWDATEGEITLQGPTTYAEFETAILATEFSTSAANPTGVRQFSITVGEANYLPSTQHYYEFVSDPNISWTDAEIAASNRTYFGLQGYLVTLTSQEEADFSGSQAQGVGWIGASDEAVEGEWRWMTGPEAGTQFWDGNVGGTELTYAFWNNNEPNDYPNAGIDGEENYAHITDNSVGILGSWNDLPNVTATSGAYSAQGYVVEYGGMSGDPVLNLTATTTIEMSLCKVITNKKITYRVNKD
ncbi:C-type lectin domain-containing protein [uncultured Maribacter sp.]|uniref:C-type lectin domain-containing protein n=1 Tax=uncultured Maribacter sp. TaxID=431308 RepID=UPI002636B5BC|nr:C-type lectin domain-containing protein [uncultured Maribacter sp.]